MSGGEGPQSDRGQEETTPPRIAPEDPGELRERGVFEFIPKRNIARALVMFAVLIGLVVMQRRSGSFIKSFTDILLRPAPSEPHKEPPAVRLAPPPPATK